MCDARRAEGCVACIDRRGIPRQLGRSEEAKEALQQAIAILPAAFERNVRNRVPWMRPEDHAHMLEGLRKAGWQG